jgi:Zn-finger protein
MKSDFSFFTNKDCEYYPCHKMPDGEELNCLFCYCPLYALGKDCGGDFRISAKGNKDCSNCTRCHGSDGYDYVRSRIHNVLELARQNS